jgi:hypothetical protein
MDIARSHTTPARQEGNADQGRGVMPRSVGAISRVQLANEYRQSIFPSAHNHGLSQRNLDTADSKR